MKKFISILLAGVLAFSLTACNTKPKMGSDNKVLATSGDEKIKLSEYLFNLGMTKSYNEYYLIQNLGLTEEDMAAYWNEPMEDGSVAADMLKESVLEDTKKNAVYIKLGKEAKFEPDPEAIKDFEASVDNAITSLATKDQTGERTFYEKYLVTKEEAIEANKNQSIGEQYKKKVKDEIVISDEEMLEYYENNQDRYEEKTIAHILVKFPDNPSQDDKDEKYALAEEILAKAEANGDFGELVTEYSEDSGSIETNGEYTITRSTNFVPEFLEWSFDMDKKQGDMGIIETSYGYHIMKYVSDSTYETVKESIRETLVGDLHYAKLEEIYEENKLEWTIDEEMYKAIIIAEPVEKSEEPIKDDASDPNSGITITPVEPSEETTDEPASTEEASESPAPSEETSESPEPSEETSESLTPSEDASESPEPSSESTEEPTTKPAP